MSKFEVMNPIEGTDNPITIWKQGETGMHIFAYIEQNEWSEFKAVVAGGEDEDEDYEMLERENKAMAEFLESLGYTQEQISDICNSTPILGDSDENGDMSH